MAIGGSDGSIILTTKVDTSGVNKGMSSIKGIVGKIGGVMAAAFSVSLLTNFGKAAIDLASDLQEVQNVVDTAFGDMSYKIEEFSKTAIEKFGLSELAAKQWASTMMAMGSGMGQSMGIGSDMAVELTGRLADVMSFYNKTEEEAFTLGKAIYSGETEPLKSIGIIMTENNLALFAMSKGYKQAYKDMDAANKLLIRQQFFLEQTSLAAGDYTKTADGWANQTRTLTQRWKEMQATFGETFIAFGVLVLPVIEQIINGLNQIALMARAAAASFGLFKEESKESEKTTNKQVVSSNSIAGNIEQQTENQKKLNKELKKGLAGFDEINTLTEQSAENTADAGAGTQISGIGGVGANYDNSFVDKVSGDMAAIMGIVGGALVAVGLLLIFFGRIGWGIGFIIAGASVFAVSMATVSSSDQVTPISEKLMAIMAIAGTALTAIGLILLFSGEWKWGIGFIIAGASALAVSIVAVESGNATEQAEQMLLDIMLIAGSAMLALGVILMCFGVISPLSIGLVVAGAGSLAGAIAINPQAVGETIKNFFQENAGLIVGVSIALIVLGIILLFTGVGIPLAIGLIVAGGGALVATVALNWNFIVDKVKEVWQKVKNFWNSYIAPIFTAKWWADLGKKAINGLLGVIESGLNWIINKINEFIGGISGIVGAVGKVIGQDWSIGKIPNVKIPRLAQGAVIPPNREFLAVLGDQKHGTNIEAPLDTIKQAVAEVLAQVNVGGGSFNGRIEVPVIIDGREIARAVRDAENSMGSQTVFGGFANVY
jgi:hypothetical protein